MLLATHLLYSAYMRLLCPYCALNPNPVDYRNIRRFGRFYRKSDSQWVQKFRCKNCKKIFSRATFNRCYRQNKRNKNEILRKLLSSGVSQRRAARILHLSRTTVSKKFIFLAEQARIKFFANLANSKPCEVLEFDDLETFEHTKCKPLSVTMAVEYKTRKILGFEVSPMPAKGHLAKIAFKKYGPRKDLRDEGRKKLFKHLKKITHPNALIKSDQNPHYPKDVAKFFPGCKHYTVKGRRGCVTGQGELKRGGFDPIFSLNHTYAKARADMNRLFRRTWCTTKKPERLVDHLYLYAVYHNENLKLGA